MASIECKLTDLARAQRGCFTVAQAQAAGWTRRILRHRIKGGVCRRVVVGVYAFTWALDSLDQRIWIAHLWSGGKGIFSHQTAAALWRLNAGSFKHVDLIHRVSHSSVPWLNLHHPSVLPRAQVRRLPSGLLLTSPARTVFDLGAVDDIADEVYQGVVEACIRRGIARQDELRDVVELLAKRGRPGTARLMRVLSGGALHPEIESDLERDALRLFQRRGLPAPVTQYEVFEGSQFLGRVDFAWPQAKLIVEADSYKFHSGRQAWDRDIHRYNAFTELGWTVLRLTSTDLKEGAPVLVRTLASGLSTRVRDPRRAERRAKQRPTAQRAPVPNRTRHLPGFD